jgi:FKBP-type peptidyl-prolyl cis-trans isomerase SlyD
MTLLVGDNLVVSMHYKLTDEEGNVLDSSEGEEPMSYLHGSKNIIPGLENALTGKAMGAKCEVKIEPGEGYGEIVPELIEVVDKSAFPGVDNIEAGMGFETQTPDGQTHRIAVKEVEGDKVTIDGNHPLAGKVLHFDIEIVGVRDATKEEIDHGHVH